MRSTFRATTTGTVFRPSGYDWQGQALPDKKRKIRCSLIRFEIEQLETSIRADRSETKARASENSGSIRILVDPRDEIMPDDRVELMGHTLLVKSVFPRIGLNGGLHHYQVDLELWQENR